MYLQVFIWTSSVIYDSDIKEFFTSMMLLSEIHSTSNSNQHLYLDEDRVDFPIGIRSNHCVNG